LLGSFKLAILDARPDFVLNKNPNGRFFVASATSWAQIAGANETWAEVDFTTVDINGNDVMANSSIFSEIDSVGGIPIYPGIGYDGMAMCYTLTNFDGSSMIRLKKMGRPSHVYGPGYAMKNGIRLIGQYANNNQNQAHVVHYIDTFVGRPDFTQTYSLYYSFCRPNKFVARGGCSSTQYPDGGYYNTCSPFQSSLSYFNRE
jgi:hypothetical protein